MSGPWLVVIDAQRIFAEPPSEWASPQWASAWPKIQRLAAGFEGRTVLTRWVPPASGARAGSWAAYMQAWPFADRPANDPIFDLIPGAAALDTPVVDAPTFGKWTPQLRAIVGETPELVLCGVSTDCCVISTALPAADAGATVTVAADACAGSSDENQAAALSVLGLYPPQIAVKTTAEILGC